MPGLLILPIQRAVEQLVEFRLTPVLQTLLSDFLRHALLPQ